MDVHFQMLLLDLLEIQLTNLCILSKVGAGNEILGK